MVKVKRKYLKMHRWEIDCKKDGWTIHMKFRSKEYRDQVLNKLMDSDSYVIDYIAI